MLSSPGGADIRCARASFVGLPSASRPQPESQRIKEHLLAVQLLQIHYMSSRTKLLNYGSIHLYNLLYFGFNTSGTNGYNHRYTVQFSC